MITLVKDMALPYTLSTDKSDVKTVFHIKCMTADMHQQYISRYVFEQNNQDATVEAKARTLVQCDRETLQRCIDHVDNAYNQGDTISTRDEIAKLLHEVDWPTLQELLRASQSMSILDADTKNA